MFNLLTLLPWAAFLAFLPVLFRRRPRLRDCAPPHPEEAPLVSVIVPARNEAMNIGACVRSLLGTTYPRYEVVVVDDRSEDGTTEILRSFAEQGLENVVVVEGEPLPDGWLGKPWACWQGYRRARGDVLVFTDADTRHGPALLGHAVGALLVQDVDLVTVLPRQILGSFWERVIMPQFLIALMLRFQSAQRVNRSRNPLDAVANGQFILVRRDAYEATGGHAAVRGEVAEDLRLAQRLVAAGRRIFLAHAEELMETRMYDSLGAIVEGWTKNAAIGSRQMAPAWLRPAMPYLIAAYFLLMWVMPPAVLIGSFVIGTDTLVRGWGAGATAISLFFWLLAYARLRTTPAHALLYPVGAAVAAWIFIRSAWRGPSIVWKGRRYDDGSRARRR